MKKTDHRFKGKYRVESSRLPDWDYAESGSYFITLCCKDRLSFFGKIISADVNLSEIGKIVQEEWLRTESIRPNVSLDEFVIMPNHFHAIIQIQKVHTSKTETVETHRGASLQRTYLKRPPKSLGSIIANFKGSVTRRVRALSNSQFAWQPGYYDHVIRDEEDLDRIRRYIRRNPVKWSMDLYYRKGP